MIIAIDKGHGCSYDGGAVGIIAEENVINSVGDLVISKLRQLGHTVLDVRPKSTVSLTDSLASRYNVANNSNVDLFVSIHANAGGGMGSEIYVKDGTRPVQATNILNNMVSLGFRNRGIKNGSQFAVVRGSKAVSMLIELFFIDTNSDVNLYNSLGSAKIADAIVKGLVGTTTNISKPNSSTKFNVGDKVKVTGTHYATGQPIASFVKGNTYTIREISGEKALIKEIVSWVYLKDLVPVSSTPAPTQPSKRYINLPKTDPTWSVYNTGGPYVTSRAIGKLAPATYGGLSYEILGTLATDVYLISTNSFGRVGIYGHSSTGATITSSPLY